MRQCENSENKRFSPVEIIYIDKNVSVQNEAISQGKDGEMGIILSFLFLYSL